MISPESQIGRVFLGLAQRLWSADTDINHAIVALEAEAVTSVSAADLLSLGRGSPDVFARALTRLFENAGYGFLTGTDPLTPGTAGSIMPMGTSLSASSPNGMKVHVGWGTMPTPASVDYRPLSVGVYLVKADTGEQIAVLEEAIRHRFFTTVNLTPYVFSSREVALKVVQYFEEGRSVDGHDVHLTAVAQTRGFVVGPAHQSTANANVPNDQQEILASIAANFPVDNPDQHYWYLGSGYHDGNEYNAADINTLAGNDSDRGESVYAVAAGTIRLGAYTGTLEGDAKLGAIVIDHGTWQSVYLHMPLFIASDAEGRMQVVIRQQHTVNGQIQFTGESITLSDGQILDVRQHFGYVGGRFDISATGYDEGLGNAHLHFLARKDGQAIDLRTAFEQAGLRVVKAFDGGPDGNWATSYDNADRLVAWNEDLQAWVNETEGLVLSRSAQLPLSPGVQTEQVWLAWENNVSLDRMEKIVWDAGKRIWVKYGVQYPSEYWDSSTRTFKPF